MRLITIALLTCVFAFAADSPFVGNWKMNNTKSKPDPNGPKMENVSGQFSQVGPTLKVVITNSGTTAAPVIIDGKEHPVPEGSTRVAGATHYTATLKGKTITSVFKKDGKTVGTRKTTLAADGKSITSITDAALPDGKKMHSVLVMDKQ